MKFLLYLNYIYTYACYARRYIWKNTVLPRICCGMLRDIYDHDKMQHFISYISNIHCPCRYDYTIQFLNFLLGYQCAISFKTTRKKTEEMGECRQTTIEVMIINWCEKHCDVVRVTKIGGTVLTTEAFLLYFYFTYLSLHASQVYNI